MMLERENASAVLPPDEFQPAALDRPKVELDVGIRGHRLVEIDAEHHGPVVAIERERGAATEERELYAMVTAWFRYTS